MGSWMILQYTADYNQRKFDFGETFRGKAA